MRRAQGRGLALRYHLLGAHGFYEDFPLNIAVTPIDGSNDPAPGDLEDLNEG